jgi:hypothetical protein
MKRGALVSLASVVVLAACFAGGCSGEFGFNGNGTGTLHLRITDKPYPYEYITEAIVTITRVEIRRAHDDAESDAAEAADEQAPADDSTASHPDTQVAGETEGSSDGTPAADESASSESTDESGGDAISDESENEAQSESADDDDRPFVVIFSSEEGKSFNLLELQNGRTDLLADAEVPAGRYDQMRIIVSEGLVTLTDGREFRLNVPSGDETGIKLHCEFEVAEDEPTVLLLDVDLSRAFSPIPGGPIESPDQIESFRFSPSIAMRLIDMLEAGGISGQVTDQSGAALPGVSVTLYRGDEEVANTSTDENGAYAFGGLPTGDYRVTFSASGYAEGEVAGVMVQAGATTTGVDSQMH